VGLGRTLALEHPEIWGGVLDLDESLPRQLAARCVLDEAGGLDEETRSCTARACAVRPGCGNKMRRALTCRTHLGTMGKQQPPRHRATKHWAASDPATGRDGGNDDRRGVPHSRHTLAELAESLESTGTTLVQVAADATDPAAMTAAVRPFGVDLPSLAGIYLRPLRPTRIARRHDRRRRGRMFRPSWTSRGWRIGCR